MTVPEVKYEVLNNQYIMDKPPKIQDKIYKIMMKCWEQEEMDRPTFEYLRQHFDSYIVASERQYHEAPEEETCSNKKGRKKSKKQ